MENYVQISSDIIRDSTISARARLIYSVLASFCKGENRHCTPAIQELLQYSGMSRDTFYRHMKELERRGIVKKQYVRSGPRPLDRQLQYFLCD